MMATPTTPRSTMITIFLIAALFLDVGTAQFDQGDRTSPCPADNNVQGYTSISLMNQDMEDELARIMGGGAVDPDRTYSMILCPGTTFDTDADTLEPVLNGLQFMCGNDGNPANGCIFSGGNEQVDIQTSSVPGYTISNIDFEGVTFEQFLGRSIDIGTTDETTISFTNSVWQNFDATNVFRMRSNNSPTVGNIELNGSSISGTASLAIRNEGGTVTVDDLTVDGANIQTLFQTSEGGRTTIENSLVTNSQIQMVTATVDGSTDLSMVEVSDNTGGTQLFRVENDSTMEFTNVDVLRNTGNNAFQILRVQGSGTVVGQNATFQDNVVRHVFIAQSNEQNPTTPTISFIDTDFISNEGNPDFNLLYSEAPGASITLQRVDFEENTGALSLIAGFFGGDIEYTRTCFFRNNNIAVAISLVGGTVVAFDNYVEDEISTICGGVDPLESGGRLSIELEEEMRDCFRPTATEDCLVDCSFLGNDIDTCMSGLLQDEVPTVSPQPTSLPSMGPSQGGDFDPTDPPSISPAPSEQGATPPPSAMMETFPPSTSNSPSMPPEPTGGPTIAETEIPTFSMFPTMSVLPTLLPTEEEELAPLVFDRSGLLSQIRDGRPHESDDDDDDSSDSDDRDDSDDSDDGKGKGGKGKGGRFFGGMMQKRKQPKRSKKLFQGKGNRGRGKLKSSKSSKSSKSGKGKGRGLDSI